MYNIRIESIFSLPGIYYVDWLLILSHAHVVLFQPKENALVPENEYIQLESVQTLIIFSTKNS